MFFLSKKNIPKNTIYCYTGIRFDDKTGIYHIKTCPYWKRMFGRVVCLYLLYIGDELLEDQCKICGISEYNEEDYE